MIFVLAGVNGAGKSSLLGSSVRDSGAEYFNPDEAARAHLRDNPSCSQQQANAHVWQRGFDLLVQAIDHDRNWAFETTLGGNKIPQQLMRAAELGRELCIWYCGLETPELHLSRVAARVQSGGHDIPEEMIQRRWQSARANLVRLIPVCTELRVYDNSAPLHNGRPQPQLLFHLEKGAFVTPPHQETPEWARPLATEAMRAVQDL